MFLSKRFWRCPNHRHQLAGVVGILCDLVVQHQSVCSINGTLHVAGYTARALCSLHQTGFRFSLNMVINAHLRHQVRRRGGIVALVLQAGQCFP